MNYVKETFTGCERKLWEWLYLAIENEVKSSWYNENIKNFNWKIDFQMDGLVVRISFLNR